MAKRLGFVGLGLMGEPMAVNLVRAGVPLTVWNRTAGKDVELRSLGAKIAMDPDEVFEECDVVCAMLADEAALDAVLGRRAAGFERRIEGRTLVGRLPCGRPVATTSRRRCRAHGCRRCGANSWRCWRGSRPPLSR